MNPPKSERTPVCRLVLRAVRPHQWLKNLLVFVPLAAAHNIGRPDDLFHALLAFVAFSLCASSVYVLNDLVDLSADRTHPVKSKRPFASGELPVVHGYWMVPVFALAALVPSLFLPGKFTVVLGSYYLLTTAYSFFLKRVVIVDVMVIAILYTLRIAGGAAACKVSLSFWLALFSVFLFLGLSLVKRCAELDALRRHGKLAASGRGYHVEDLSILRSFGAAASYMSVLVVGLYINSPQVEGLYRHPKAIWFVCVLLLYWVSRMWMKAHRGLMNEDPLVFALKDKASWLVGGLCLLTFWMAT